MLFAAPNLTQQTVAPSIPWEYIPGEMISAQVRKDKESRQNWYRNPATTHNFYTGIEGLNPNCRPTKTNSPHRLHALIVDYDLPLDDARVMEVVPKFKFKPSWMERSLGGNVRLVWLLEIPIPLASFEFSVFVLQAARAWIGVDLLPGVDEGAFEDPTRLYCNGCKWTPLGGVVPRTEAQAFFVRCGHEFHFNDATMEVEVPLDVVESALKAEFGARFSWPGSFELGSTGPSFWIPESTSPQSAIVKKDGLFTFSAHADRPFYPWKALLGDDFAKKFETTCIGKATDQIYFDSTLYWVFYPQQDCFCGAKEPEITRHLRVNFRVSTKPDRTGISTMDRCLDHIHKNSRVKGGAPVLFHPPGLFRTDCGLIVNTAGRAKITLPVDEAQQWGDEGNFPFISKVFDNIFDPANQKDPFLAWLRHFYVTSLAQKPEPGQNIFIAGGAGVGKTMTNRLLIGGLMGGYVDGSKFLTGGEDFNSHLFESAVWSVDDETISDSDVVHRRFSAYIKLCAANQAFLYRRKFEHNVMVPWMGRIIVTLNLDESSTRTLPALDGTILDKISFFKCVSESKIEYPNRYKLTEMMKTELPFFARWLIDWKIPDCLVGESRYGVKPHHEASLIDRAHQSSRSAPFKELLIEFLAGYFKNNPGIPMWKGNVTQLMRGLNSDPMNDVVMRSLRLDQVNRFIESLSREGVLSVSSESGDRKTRIWVFQNFLLTNPSNPVILDFPKVVENFGTER